jgi:hypothetical protein
MKNIFKNWKTTLAGLITIVVSLLSSKGKIDGPTATAITMGTGLILAKDHDTTDTTTTNN